MPRPLLPLLLAGLAACGPDPRCADPGVICTLAGIPGLQGYNGEHLPARGTMLYFPSSLALDPEGRLTVDDFNNMRIRRLEGGILTTIAGNGVHAYATPGALALDSAMENPVDIAWDETGALVIAELHAARVLRVDEDGRLVVIAGTGDPGFAGDGGPATDATLSQAGGIAITAEGELVVADTDNHCLRHVDASGTITSLVGDGLPAQDPAHLDRPQKVRVLGRQAWVADTNNNRIQRVDLDTGAVVTVAGTGAPGDTGDGGPATAATLNQPYGVHPDPDGGLWIADTGNHRVRYVHPDGTLETVAGTGVEGFAGDEGPATEAALDFPIDVLRDGDTLYIADMLNGTVREIITLDL